MELGYSRPLPGKFCIGTVVRVRLVAGGCSVSTKWLSSAPEHLQNFAPDHWPGF